MFRDELVRGPLRKLVHDHFFEPVGQGTEMRDVFEFESSEGWRRFLLTD